MTRGPYGTSLTWKTFPNNKQASAKIWFYQYKGKNNKLQNKVRYFPFEKRNDHLSVKKLIPSIQGCLYKAWLIISSSNEDFKKVAMFFIVTINYSWKGTWSFTWTNLNPLHAPMDRCFVRSLIENGQVILEKKF